MRGNRFGFLVVLLGLAAACATFGGRGSADAPRMGQEELRARLGGPGVVVLDVRAFHDWEASGSRIAGAIREDPGGVGKWAGKYSPDQTLVLYCA